MKFFDRDLDGAFNDDLRNSKQMDKKIYKDLTWMFSTSGCKIPYDEHEQRMDDGWRAPTCKEYFALLYAYEEGLLDEYTNGVVEDMEGHTEILNCAIRLKEESLEIYQMIEGLVYDHNFFKYSTASESWYGNMYAFDISELGVNRNISLEEINQKFPAMLELFYGRRFNELPDAAKDATIFIPRLEDHILIAGSGDDESLYNLDLSRYKSLSRGVLLK